MLSSPQAHITIFLTADRRAGITLSSQIWNSIRRRSLRRDQDKRGLKRAILKNKKIQKIFDNAD